MTTTNTQGAADLIAALKEAQSAINSMKVEAETAAQGDEQMMLEACETISNEGLQADMAIRAALAFAAAPSKQEADATHLRELAAYRLTVENLEREIAAQQPAPSAAAVVNPDPHAELRKTWQPGQRWQARSFRNGQWGPWTDAVASEPFWFPHQDYRRHPDDLAPQPSTTAQAASSAVLKAIREANMQLVRTGDDEFMLVTYKNAKAQCDGGKCGIGGYCDDCPTPQADSQPAPDEIINMAREQGLPETEIKGVFRVNVDDLGRMFAADRAARAPADSVLEAAALSSEQQRAIFEAYESAASESYFEVRPQIDCNDRRRVFKAGYERGWDAARKQGGHK